MLVPKPVFFSTSRIDSFDTIYIWTGWDWRFNAKQIKATHLNMAIMSGSVLYRISVHSMAQYSFKPCPQKKGKERIMKLFEKNLQCGFEFTISAVLDIEDSVL